jgi:hypothetical protein
MMAPVLVGVALRSPIGTAEKQGAAASVQRI